MNPRYWLALAFAAGLLVRYEFRDYATSDTFRYLLPWYSAARELGFEGLGTAFTNYTPLYEYLLLGVTRLHGIASPLLLIKTISFAFELATAVVAYHFVRLTHKGATRPAIAFALSWLAPTVLLNGAMWGQCDSIWSFFVLLAIYLFYRGKQGTLPFAVAFGVKAQGIFLAPFVLGMLLRRPRHWLWLLTLPVAYFALALPRLLAGGSLWQVMGVYLNQGGTFHRLSMNAANLWIFAPNVAYREGVVLGLIVAAGAGLAITTALAKCRRITPEYILLAACASLLFMPYFLPKMHERYFYAFELASISLACINARYAAVAAIAQVDGVLAYMPFDRQWSLSYDIYAAALCNSVLVLFFLRQLLRPEQPQAVDLRAYAGYATLCICFGAFLFYASQTPATVSTSILGTLFCVLLPLQAFLMLRGTAPSAK